MKEGVALPHLVCELERQASAKKDWLVRAQDLEVRSNGSSKLVVDRATDREYQLNDIAHAQLAEYTGVPKPFYDRLRGATEELRVSVFRERHEFHDSNVPLFDTVVNALLGQKGSDVRLVRTLDGKARALLSDSFTVDLDNYDVFRVAAKAISEAGLGPENVLSAQVTERKLYIKVVSPKLEASIQPGNLERPHGGHSFLKEPQVVQAGFIVSNSEVGLGSLSVQPMVYKLMCTNAWIMEEGLRARHIGKALQSDLDGAVYQSDTRLAEAKVRLLKIRDHVQAALDEVRFRGMVQRMQASAELPLDSKVDKVVEATARRFALKETEKDQLLQELIAGADLTLWGLSNAVTAMAKTVESYDRSTELETIGGRMLMLPKADIAELVSAS